MSLDTAKKRQSGLAQRFGRLPFGRRFLPPLPDGTIDQADRQTLGFAYGGISAGEPIPAYPDITFTARNRGTVWGPIARGTVWSPKTGGR